MKKSELQELNLVTLAKEYADEDKARELLESLRWPRGPICPHCHNQKDKPIYTLTPKRRSSTRKGVYKCGACRKQFTVTVGSVMESSHIKLSTWAMAIFILCSSKKSMSAHQLHRMLGVTYKTAWFMCHRLRFAMMPADKEPKLSGTVEVDETYCGPKSDIQNSHSSKQAVVALVQRDGPARLEIVSSITQKNAGEIIRKHVDPRAILNTDEHKAYQNQFKDFKRHDSVCHSRMEYSRKNKDGTKSGINSCESFFSTFKRAIVGSWHHISPEHLPKYAREFVFHWNTRHDTDGERMGQFVPMIAGKRLTYRQAV